MATEPETPADTIDPGTRSVIEAVLFVAEAPVPAKEMAEVLEIPTDQVEDALSALEKKRFDPGSRVVL